MMTISKKMFLIGSLLLGFGFQLSASQNYTEKQKKNFFIFTQKLSQQEHADDMNLARWANETYY